MAYTVQFKVGGCGKFPIDMLRYEACYPVHERETRNIEKQEPGWRSRVPIVICLEKRFGTKAEARLWSPTKGRWESFGWTVLDD